MTKQEAEARTSWAEERVVMRGQNEWSREVRGVTGQSGGMHGGSGHKARVHGDGERSVGVRGSWVVSPSSPIEQQRQSVIQEIITTEATYLTELLLVDEVSWCSQPHAQTQSGPYQIIFPSISQIATYSSILIPFVSSSLPLYSDKRTQKNPYIRVLNAPYLGTLHMGHFSVDSGCHCFVVGNGTHVFLWPPTHEPISSWQPEKNGHWVHFICHAMVAGH